MKRKPEKLYLRTFAVKGRGPFPIDMLRYDRAWPADEFAASWLGESSATTYRIVRLAMVSETADGGPTERRWRSFDWEVCESMVSGLEGGDGQ